MFFVPLPCRADSVVWNEGCFMGVYKTMKAAAKRPGKGALRRHIMWCVGEDAGQRTSS